MGEHKIDASKKKFTKYSYNMLTFYHLQAIFLGIDFAFL